MCDICYSFSHNFASGSYCAKFQKKLKHQKLFSFFFNSVLTLLFEHVCLAVRWEVAQTACLLLDCFGKSLHVAILICFKLLDAVYLNRFSDKTSSDNRCGLYAHPLCPSILACLLWHPEGFFRWLSKVCNCGFWHAEGSYLVCGITSALWAVALLRLVAQSLALFFSSCV